MRKESNQEGIGIMLQEYRSRASLLRRRAKLQIPAHLLYTNVCLELRVNLPYTEEPLF